jgi:hypothetical protein
MQEPVKVSCSVILNWQIVDVSTSALAGGRQPATVCGVIAACPAGHWPRSWLLLHILTGPPPKQYPVSVSVVVPKVPVPLTDTVCRPPGALSVNVTVPFRLPVVLGERVTLIVQFAPGARVDPQLLVSAKLALAAIPVMLSVAVPELASVIGRGWLAVPSTSSPKVRLFGESATFADPLPIDVPVADTPPQPVSAPDQRRVAMIKAKNLDFIPPSVYSMASAGSHGPKGLAIFSLPLSNHSWTALSSLLRPEHSYNRFLIGPEMKAFF